MQKYDFIAIDVETATLSKPRFICQIGLAFVRRDQIVRTESFLIQPPHNQIHYRTTMVHGIYETDTQDAPIFPQVWSQIEQELSCNQLVAHNAAFDASVIEENLSYYHLPNMLNPFRCTYQLLHRGLKDLCFGYQIDYTNHHDACFDAQCCAQFYINYQHGIWPDASKMSLPKKRSNKRGPIAKHLLIQDLSNANPLNPFYNKKVVITGVFDVDRTTIAESIQRMGAKINSSISRQTDFLIKGYRPGPAKLKQVDSLRDEGYNIQIITEPQLMKVLNEWNS